VFTGVFTLTASKINDSVFKDKPPVLPVDKLTRKINKPPVAR
jgi:hypothetical protein